MENRVLGIIAEYNPLHKGHIYQMEKCKANANADFTIVVMSGDFTQRGEPAIIDKWSRAKAALMAGADLVVELPFYYACNSAQYFAKGAVDILASMGIVTHLGFGSESGDIRQLYKASEAMLYETEEVSKQIREYLNLGMSFPAAAAKAFGCDKDAGLFEPNNILAVEYIKAIIEYKSTMVPITVKRHKAEHHQNKISKEYASSSAVRKTLQDGKYEKLFEEKSPIPKFSAELIKANEKRLIFKNSKKYFDILRSKVLTTSREELAKIFSVGEGLENKLKNEIRYASDLDAFITRLKSKRYPATRLQRICTHTIMDFKKKTGKPSYIRVLGFNSNGAKLIKKMKKSDRLSMPIITNINKDKTDNISMDVRASDIYNLLTGRDLYEYSDYVKMPEIFE